MDKGQVEPVLLSMVVIDFCLELGINDEAWRGPIQSGKYLGTNKIFLFRCFLPCITAYRYFVSGSMIIEHRSKIP